MTKETAVEQIYDRMIERACELQRWYVLSNLRMRQMECAKTKLKEYINNNGDIGMCYVMEKLDDEYRKEKEYNKHRGDEYYSYINFISEYERDVSELIDLELGYVRKRMESELSKIHEETKEDELTAFKKFCQ